eukprot:1153639-Pelagomonas_calceolata.AAC.3
MSLTTQKTARSDQHGATIVLQKSYKGFKGKRPQSRRFTASLFTNAHEIIKEKRKFVVILVYKSINILGIRMVNVT